MHINPALARDLVGRKSDSALRHKTRLVGGRERCACEKVAAYALNVPAEAVKAFVRIGNNWRTVGEFFHSLKAYVVIAVLLTLFLTITTARAQDKIEMELTVFKGNKELPKVLYIVPWKRLADGNIQQKLVLHSLFEDAFDPIEPQTFERYVDDYRYFANSQSE